METGKMSVKKKVFVVAMACEAEAVVRCLSGVRTETMFGRKVFFGTLGGEPTAVIVSGIGKVNAAASTQLAIATLGAEKVLNVGVAGGLDPKLRVGDLLRVARVVQYDFDLSKINGTPIGTLDEYKTPFFELAVAGEGLPEATVATGDRFADGEEIVNFLRKTFGANVCEMELGAIAHVASRAGVKVHSWKAISDVAGNGTQADQYKRNLDFCLGEITAKLPALFKAV